MKHIRRTIIHPDEGVGSAVLGQARARRKGVPNARFWIYLHDSWVKLTLTPDQGVNLEEGGPCEEGWYHNGEAYRHEHTHVISMVGSDGADCDGRMSSGSDHSCPLADLRSDIFRDPDLRRDPHNHRRMLDPIPRPMWTESGRSQRDYTAEAMGY